ncbi:hypothetical protein [Klebsiella pneumoniae]|uniref:hypothetical protein n=1 Tax=Klebsiella pneumoniae TaxID=573 RepID=UPI001B3C1727|nr:hypothetical protein [Klebsiella pneumoniae]MCP5803279.1 hypothetical protein [Klebsiella pneumoniae]MDK9312590.1 hypothetical protein [Klebsiella pneumoniae]MDK9317843.1 hypothetical protein [Klebsiella pneumoniae]MDK9371288.1 hypothetical protein [Klebsiella pneumoniae]MDK9381317.1 hypothetical protein [Klebsiella pneumoniae]
MTDITRLINSIKRCTSSARELGYDVLFVALDDLDVLADSLETALRANAAQAAHIEQLQDTFNKLAAENVALKNAFGPGDSVLNFLTIALRHTTYDRIDLDDVTLAFKMSLPETPATDRIVAGIKADGVEEFAAKLRIPGYDQFFDALAKGVALAADDFAKQLREGGKV